MRTNAQHIGRTAVAVLALVAVASGCSSDQSGVATKQASAQTAATNDHAPEATADAAPDTTPDTTPDSTADSAPTTPDSTPDTTPLGGVTNRPEGTWTLINRLEEANPPYDDFVAGKPDVEQWEIHPQCDDGLCDLKIEPGANGFFPSGSPAKSVNMPGAFTLELRADNSFAGHAVVDNRTCQGSDGSDVSDGADRSFDYSMVFLPQNGIEAPRIEGSLTSNQVPTAAGAAAGCIEFHDRDSLVGQPLDYWKDVDPTTLTFGTYDWGGYVADADDYYLDNTSKVGDYVTLNSDLALGDGCTDDPCSIEASGVVPAYGDKTGTFRWDGQQFTVETTFEDTCADNDTHDVIVEHGYDITDSIALVPVIVEHGTVLAWSGEFTEVGTPTPEAVAASPDDCFPQHLELALGVSTTKPYFNGL